MRFPNKYETENLDLAAYLTATGREPTICQQPGKAVFVFESDDQLIALITEFTTGRAVAKVTPLLGARRRLFMELRRLRTA